MNSLSKKNSEKISSKPISKIIKKYDSDPLWYYVYFYTGLEKLQNSDKGIKISQKRSSSSHGREASPTHSSSRDVVVPIDNSLPKEKEVHYQSDNLQQENQRLVSENFLLRSEIQGLNLQIERLREEMGKLKGFSPEKIEESPPTDERRSELDIPTQELAQSLIYSFRNLQANLIREKIKEGGLSDIIRALEASLHDAEEWLEPLESLLTQGYSVNPTLRKHLDSKDKEPSKGLIEYAMSQLYRFISAIGIHLEELAHASQFVHSDGRKINGISQFAKIERENFLSRIEEGLGIRFLPISLFSEFKREWKTDEWVTAIQVNIPPYYPHPKRIGLRSDFVYFIQSLGYMDLEGHVREKTEIVVHT